MGPATPPPDSLIVCWVAGSDAKCSAGIPGCPPIPDWSQKYMSEVRTSVRRDPIFKERRTETSIFKEKRPNIQGKEISI